MYFVCKINLILKSNQHRVLGIMSGSSLDGIDFAYCDFRYENADLVQWELGQTQCFDIPEDVKQELRDYGRLDPKEMTLLEKKFTLLCKDAVSSFLEDNKLIVDFIGLHGQTLFHCPEEGVTCQLGDGKLLQYLLDIPVISDFRKEDILEGGQGTPMAPLADKYLFSGSDVYLNLGGIANMTYWRDKHCVAYDLFPFNQYFNHYAKAEGLSYDKDGAIGRSGNYQDVLVELFSSFPYFDKQGAKSLDNNWIMQEFIPQSEKADYSVADKMNSYYHFCVKHLMERIPGHTESIFITGGGAYNKFFIDILRYASDKKGIEIIVPMDKIVDYKEAALIALAASYKWLGKENFIASATGASKSVIGGTIYQ